MALFSFKRKAQDPPDSGEASKAKRTIKRSPPVAMEVKLLALEGLEVGLSAEEVGELPEPGELKRLLEARHPAPFVPRHPFRARVHHQRIVELRAASRITCCQ